MQIGAIGKALPSGSPPPRRSPASGIAAPVPAVAATATAAPATRPGLSSGRPLAGFLAQLIAAQEGLPQARARRRLDPGTAAAAYAVAAAPVVARGAAFSRRVG